VKVAVCLDGLPPGRFAQTALHHAARLVSRDAVQALVAAAARPEPALVPPLGPWAAELTVVADPALGLTDYLGTGHVLARAVEQLGAQLVLAGALSRGERTGSVPAAMANTLDWTFVARVTTVERSADWPHRITVTISAGGRLRRLDVPLPCVLTVAGPAAWDAVAGDAAVTVRAWGLSDIGLAAQEIARASHTRPEDARRSPTRTPIAIASAGDLLSRLLPGGGHSR
jgi:electron transfer flavoprotein alpha/beta subunit